MPAKPKPRPGTRESNRTLVRATTIANRNTVTKGQITLPETGGMITSFRIIAYPYFQRAKILDEVITGMSWSEQAETCAVTLNFEVKNNGDFARLSLRPGTWLQIQYVDPITGNWKYLEPPFRVWSRTIPDYDNRIVRVTAYDMVMFLQQSDPQNWFFRADKRHKKGWRADEIASRILFDLEIPAKLFRTDYQIPYMDVQGHTPYEMIVKAYTRDSQVSQVRYRIQARGKAIQVVPYMNQSRRWEITAGSNMVASEWEETLEGTFTELIMLSTQGELINRGVRVLSPNVSQYGRIRSVITIEKNVRQKVLRKVARISLNNVDKTVKNVSITATGLLPLRASDAVYVKDAGAGISGNFFVKSIDHTIAAGQHTMEVELDTEVIVPTNYPSREELVKAKTSGVAGRDKITSTGGLGITGGAATEGATTNTGPVGGAVTVAAGTAANLDQYLRRRNSVLAGLGGVMVQQGQTNGVDPRLCVAVAGAETEFAKTGGAVGLKNAWGLGPGIRYPSWEAAVGAFFRTIKSFTGLNTIAQIQTKYAPSGAGNDPTGLNNNWVRNTSAVYAELGGDPNGSVRL